MTLHLCYSLTPKNLTHEKISCFTSFVDCSIPSCLTSSAFSLLYRRLLYRVLLIKNVQPLFYPLPLYSVFLDKNLMTIIFSNLSFCTLYFWLRTSLVQPILYSGFCTLYFWLGISLIQPFLYSGPSSAPLSTADTCPLVSEVKCEAHHQQQHRRCSLGRNSLFLNVLYPPP